MSAEVAAIQRRLDALETRLDALEAALERLIPLDDEDLPVHGPEGEEIGYSPGEFLRRARESDLI